MSKIIKAIKKEVEQLRKDVEIDKNLWSQNIVTQTSWRTESLFKNSFLLMGFEEDLEQLAKLDTKEHEAYILKYCNYILNNRLQGRDRIFNSTNMMSNLDDLWRMQANNEFLRRYARILGKPLKIEVVVYEF
jgi:hypothetical protein